MSLVLGIPSSLWSFGPTAMWLDRLPQGDAQ